MTNLHSPEQTKRIGSRTGLMSVLFADLVDYGLHSVRDEQHVLAFLAGVFEHFDHRYGDFNGRLVKTMGDGVMAVFPTASKAVGFAVEMQQWLASYNGHDNEFQFRFGVHVGEVLLRDDDVLGHAVNVAARLESLSVKGGVCISQDVFMMIRNSGRFEFESLGGHRFKHVPGQTMLYNVIAASVPRTQKPVGEIVEMSTIGPLQAEVSGTAVMFSRSCLAQACLGYLALCPGQAESIEHLAVILRPDLPKNSARRAIRGAVKVLQSKLDKAVINVGGVLRLDQALLRVDILVIEDAVRLGHPGDELVRLGDWSQRLLEGLETVSSQFSAWLTVARAEWRDRIASLLEIALSRQDDPSTSSLRDVAMALLAIEPGHERAARNLIRHYSAVGNPGAAVRVFERLTQVLKDRYGVSPHAETVATLEGRSRAKTGSVLVSHVEPLRLQLHHFEVEQGQSSELINTFRSELMAGLACFRGWSVVEGVQERRKGTTVPDYAVTAKLSGKHADSLTVSLTDVATDRLVWTDRFEISVSQLESVRRQVVGRISATVEVYITTDRATMIGSSRHRAVIDTWLQAERIIPRWTTEAHDTAAATLSDLISQSPNFAPAFASLASILNVRHIVRPGQLRDADRARRAHALADRAIEIDPLDARNQLAAAWSAALDSDFDKASVNMDLAARLNPHSPRTLLSASMGFSFLGEHGRALELLDHSLQCAPVLLDYQWCYAASVYFLAGENEAALQAAERSGDKIIDNPGWTAAALVRLGRRAEAAAAYSKLVREVSADWCGPEPVTPSAVSNWFTQAYPFRNQADREYLSDTLSEALSGLNRPPN